ncbi:MAG: biotin synthase BioB [Rikenellaceae bacterium]
MQDIFNKIRHTDESLDRCEVIALINYAMCAGGYNSERLEEIYEVAHEVTQKYLGDRFDSCSIINAKSGNCSENCSWCAQSAHHKTKVEIYDLVGKERTIIEAAYNSKCGIKRFSMVTSGKRSSKKDVASICDIIKDLPSEIAPCVSLGLLEKAELQQLKDAGVTRYHCNMESSPAYFPKLCTTHTHEDKLATLMAAREVGMTLCSGGIIGMGESMEDRVDLAILLRDNEILSIPINILQPIAGTPLEGSIPVSDEEYLLTVALFRIINPKAFLRFSGGRAQLSIETQKKALYIGINAAIMGDMLTTLGTKAREDRELFSSVGYNFDWVGENPFDKNANRDE